MQFKTITLSKVNYFTLNVTKSLKIFPLQEKSIFESGLMKKGLTGYILVNYIEPKNIQTMIILHQNKKIIFYLNNNWNYVSYRIVLGPNDFHYFFHIMLMRITRC